MCIEITFLDFWMLLVRVAGIGCPTIGGWVDLFIWYLVSNLNFRVLTKSPTASYRINLMTLIRHCMSPHYRCPLFSLFCDLSSNHVQHTMITMWSSHREESPPKKRMLSLSMNFQPSETWSSYIHVGGASVKLHHANRSAFGRPSFIEMGRLESQLG